MMYFGESSTAQLAQGNCMHLMSDIPSQSVNLILCDPPYGTTDCEGDDKLPLAPLWVQYERLLAPGGCVILFAAMPFTAELYASNRAWYRDHIVWNKNKCGSPALRLVRPMRVHEDILIFAPGAVPYSPIMEEGEPYSRKSKRPEGYVGKKNDHGYGMKPRTEFVNTGTRYPKSIRNVSREFRAQDQVHPHQKPLALMEWLLLTYSKPGDVVLDNAMGSGTTGLACLNTGRNFIGYELRKQPFDVACSRLSEQSKCL